MLSARELERANSITQPRRRKTYFASRVLRRKILADVIACDVAELHFGREETGKPFLQNHLRHFSLTHTDELIALAVSTRPVGIDIEHSERKFNPRLAKRYFHQQENSILSADDNFNLTFASLWTLKEAYAKATGAGIFASISKLQVESISPTLTITSDQNIHSAGCWRFDGEHSSHPSHDPSPSPDPRPDPRPDPSPDHHNATWNKTMRQKKNYTLSVACLDAATSPRVDPSEQVTETSLQRVNADFSLQDLPAICIAQIV
ncbi:MAG: 4'-phosphopantetheinyl transferase superfamily protein [Pseudomonadales bacterium]|nr:4'-phosphopantetheinyl transferase superfamily protein [Pseudomonadales bacterium]